MNAGGPRGPVLAGVDGSEPAGAALSWVVREAAWRGAPARALVAQSTVAQSTRAQSTRAQLVVVGAHGRGAWGRLLLRSVSRAVLHRAACPVAVVHPQPLDERARGERGLAAVRAT